MKKHMQKFILKTAVFLVLTTVASPLFAAEKAAGAVSGNIFYNPLFIAFALVIVTLGIVIISFSNIIYTASKWRAEKEIARRKSADTNMKSPVLLLVAGLFARSAHAAGDTATASVKTIAGSSFYGLDKFAFYILVSIIAVELIIIGFLYLFSMRLLKERKVTAKKAIKTVSFMEKMNASVSIENEKDIMLDHNYDGIRELDNNLPPWWKYGFYFTILFAAVYMIHYHVSNTGKLQMDEYRDQLANAENDLKEFRKKAANLVDENNVTALTDQAALNAGKLIYMTNCAACHGKAGEGTVGPNLTDEYWLHKGGIKDIFRSVKLGWPEKGMKSWQQDLSARQIHEVSSYILSLKGSNPPNPKEKQGDLYMEESGSDTTQNKEKISLNEAQAK